MVARFALACVLSSLGALSLSCAQTVEVGDDTGRSQEARDERLDTYAREIAGEWSSCGFAGSLLTMKYNETRSGSILLQLVTTSSGPVGQGVGQGQSGDAVYDVVDINVDGSVDIMVSGDFPAAAILVYRPERDVILLERIEYRRKGSACP